MCNIFANTDPILYESRSRAVRIHGMATSVRLENLFWNVLAELAARDGMTTNQLIVTLYDEVMSVRGEVQNLASFLRVTCVRYLTMAQQRAETSPAPASGEPREDGVISLLRQRPRGA
ncbi:ribbon-helix-helix domain-containing protein [Azospirillum thermophilum]|uniref:Aryl-sulfate sulfotransferase n=1 Tax=Azospirillum thermophilum TaxID=2202148 RepID=A0A2S2CY96_9PROT|nr:ribbon-helix-helix domain-containing protein [Azospirillum thermophilum]AWK89428.1 aryl-sulfate sulfotransferase [Azospirillum thermophilum]